MSKCLVIGANGFIGSHLVDELVELGHDVTVFDRFSAPTAHRHTQSVNRVVGDFLSNSDLSEAVAGQEHVFHFLSTTTPVTAENDPTLDVRTNVAQTISLLESCVRADVSRFYFASTGGAIYGSQDRSEHFETDMTEPLSPYAIGKLSIEHYLRYFRAKHGLQSVALRISNPYGTRQHPAKKQGLIPIVLRQVVNGQPVVRFGDGSMVRDYIYVNDLVKMIAPMVSQAPMSDVYNLGSGMGFTVNAVFDSIRRITGIDFEVVERPVPSTFVDRVVLNTQRYVQEFGAQAITPLDLGVSSTFDEITALADADVSGLVAT